MKRLILVRHGKSSWDNDLPDDERPLKKRAYDDAELVLNGFKSAFEKPLIIWSSYAKRALTTAKIFKERLEIKEEDFHVKTELYTFDAPVLLQTIQTCDNNMDQLMVFGHNPAMTEVVNSLGSSSFDNIPTTGLCVIEFETDSWKDLENGKTLLYLFPKNLR